jgi:ABC-2 type transport system permease protein
MRAYLAIFAARARLLLQYRAAALAGFVTQCWWGVMRIMVMAAFFHGAGAGQPLSLGQTMTYVWLGQGFLMLLPWNVDPEITRMVRTGDVAYERLRPLDAHGMWLARGLARRFVQPLMRCVPMVITAGVLLPLFGLGAWGLRPPASLEAAGLFAVSILLAMILSGVITAMMEAVVAATLTDRGVIMIMTPLSVLLTGNIIPLPLFPAWARTALFVQPFAGLTDIPFRIYLGNLSGGVALEGLLLQVGWIMALTLAGRAFMSAAMSRLQVQGG